MSSTLSFGPKTAGWRVRACSLALLAVAALPADAQGPYRWTDAEGKTHYSETPPPGQSATAVTVDPNPPVREPEHRTSKKCETPKCLGDQMEADRLKREKEYARRRAENEKTTATPKPETKRAGSAKETNDRQLRENCLNGLYYGTNARIDCDDAHALRQAQKNSRGASRAGRDPK